MGPIAHWDDVGSRRRDFGHIGASWADLGSASGSVATGVKRIRIDPGKWSTPAHVELAEEEIFYVLGGSGLSWQDGATYEVGRGDCLVHLVEAEAHTLRAGAEGLDVLAFGQRALATTTRLPRTGVAWVGSTWVEIGRGRHPFDQEAAAGPPVVGEPGPRPPRIVALDDVVSEERWGGATVRDLGRAAGSRRTGLRHVVLAAGAEGAPPHCHSEEEELFVVLAGTGTCVLGDEELGVRAGSVVSRPAATAVAHSFRAGEPGLTYLAFGTREPGDIVFFPRDREVSLRGVGVRFRLPG